MGVLKINTAYMDDLAKKQEQAAGEIEEATYDLSDSVAKLWWDHGPVCGECITAMQEMEEARERAGNNMRDVSIGLAEKLRSGATLYAATDQQAGDSIDMQVITR